MRAFEGTVRVRLNAEKGTVILDRGIESSTLTAADAEKILSLAIEAGQSRAFDLDRWSFFVPELSNKLGKTANGLDPKQVLKAMKVKGTEVRLRAGKWGKPVMVIAAPQTGAKRESKYIDIA